MVLKVAPDLGTVRHNRDAVAAQQIAVADPRELQQLRRVDRAETGNDGAARACLERPTPVSEGDTHRPARFEQYSQGMRP